MDDRRLVVAAIGRVQRDLGWRQAGVTRLEGWQIEKTGLGHGDRAGDLKVRLRTPARFVLVVGKQVDQLLRDTGILEILVRKEHFVDGEQ